MYFFCQICSLLFPHLFGGSLLEREDVRMALDAYHRELAKLAASSSSNSSPHFPPPLFHPGASLPNGLSGAQDLTMPKRLSPLDTKDKDDIKVRNHIVWDFSLPPLYIYIMYIADPKRSLRKDGIIIMRNDELHYFSWRKRMLQRWCDTWGALSLLSGLKVVNQTQVQPHPWIPFCPHLEEMILPMHRLFREWLRSQTHSSHKYELHIVL
jgi:hypothetical protein